MSLDDLPGGYMKDAKGALVPIDTIKPEHLAEDDLVRDLAGRAEVLSAALTAYRTHALDEVAAFRDLIFEKYGAKKGGQKGNVTLTTFDGTLQLQVSIGETLNFGPELQAAKQLIDDCVLRWSAASGAELKALVQHAFQTNKRGKIDTGRVLGLRRLEIEDTDWRRAMDAISDAVRVTGAKTYVRVYRRDPKSEMKKAIPLDLANA